MTEFGIQIDDGSEKLPQIVVEKNSQSVELYDWQRRAIEYFFKHHKVIYEITTGGGKTFCAIEILKQLLDIEPSLNTLIVVPKNIILETVWFKELYNAGFSMIDVGVFYGGIKEYGKNFTITNMQNLELIQLEIFDVAIFDECFAGNTIVTTIKNNTERKMLIKNIVNKRLEVNVLSYNLKTKKVESKKVIDWYKIKEKRKVIDIKLEDGTILTVTPDQLIYNGEKYIQAKNLKINDYVLKDDKKEIRYCKCGCGKSFIHPRKGRTKYINGHFLLGRTLIEVWGEKAKGIIEKRSARLKGKKYEEIYGEKKGKEMREHISRTRKGKKLNRVKPCYRKGLTYEEAYGKEKAKEIKQKIITANLNNGPHWTKKEIIVAYQKIPKIRKTEWVSYRKKGLLPDWGTMKKYWNNIDNFSIEAGKTFLQPLYKISGIGQNEKIILDTIEKDKNISLERQYKIKNFYVDGYDKLNNVVYEIDESYHKYNNHFDKIRENKIKNILNCTFVRINEQQFILCQTNTILGDFIIR